MAQYDVTCACGHRETIRLTGPGRSRDWALRRRAQELCTACADAEREAQREHDAAVARAASAAEDLPPLVGTPKQIRYAEVVRRAVLDATHALVTAAGDREDPTLPATLQRLYAQDSAAWWLDHRETPIPTLLAMLRDTPADPIPAAEWAAMAAEARVRPESPVTETVARIQWVDDQKIVVTFPERRDDVRALLKELGYSWAKGWERLITQTMGEPQDRLAEVGHRLLALGIPIEIGDPRVRERAVTGTYAPEVRRWVKALTGGEYQGWVVFTWPRGDELYDGLKRQFRAGRWISGVGFAVPPEHYAAIRDAAAHLAFGMTPAADHLLQAAAGAHDATLTVTVPEPVPSPAPAAPGRVPAPLPIPEEVAIDAEFRDDD